MPKPKTARKRAASTRSRKAAPTIRVPTADLESLRALVDQIGVVFHKDECRPGPSALTYLTDFDQDIPLRRPRGPVWTTATGQRIIISAMTDSHLRNTLAMLIHRAEGVCSRQAHHDPCPGIYTPELRKLLDAPPIRIGDSEKWLLREVPAFAALRDEFLRRERSKP